MFFILNIFIVRRGRMELLHDINKCWFCKRKKKMCGMCCIFQQNHIIVCIEKYFLFFSFSFNKEKRQDVTVHKIGKN